MGLSKISNIRRKNRSCVQLRVLITSLPLFIHSSGVLASFNVLIYKMGEIVIAALCALLRIK